MLRLTDRQRDVLEYIVTYYDEKGRSPSPSEVMKHFRLSSRTSAYQFFSALEEKGYLESRRDHESSFVYRAPTDRALALFRKVTYVEDPATAGSSAASVQGERLPFHYISDLLPAARPGDVIMVAHTAAMSGDDINPGTLLLIRPAATPHDGAICSIRTGDRFNLRRVIFESPRRVRLSPSNDQFPTVTCYADRLDVAGVVVASLDIKRFV